MLNVVYIFVVHFVHYHGLCEQYFNLMTLLLPLHNAMTSMQVLITMDVSVAVKL